MTPLGHDTLEGIEERGRCEGILAEPADEFRTPKLSVPG
jgi:hypothetical protein